MGIKLDYFYNNQTERFQFYRIPKVLVKSKYYSGITLESKLLYSFMLDRTSYSIKKGMYDENGRIYIIYPVDEMQNDIQRGHSTVSKLLKELDNVGLIERKCQGLGKPDLIFLKNFASDNVMKELFESRKKTTDKNIKIEWISRDPKNGSQEIQNVDVRETGKQDSENSKIEWISRDPKNGSQEIQNMDVKETDKQDSENSKDEWVSRDPKNGSQEIQNMDVKKSANQISEIQNVEALNNTDLNDTNLNDTSFSLKQEFKEEDDQVDNRWRDFIKTQVDYDDLKKEYVNESGLIDKFIDVIVNVFTCEDDLIRVNSKNKSKNKVVSQLMNLRADHIRNVIQKLEEFNKIDGSLSESYILTCLYNSLNVYNVEKTGDSKHKSRNEVQPSLGTKFSNFEERDYDFAELEKKFARN